MDFLRLFDSYNRQARLYPSLLVVMPALVMFLAWAPSALDAGKTIVGIAAACGFFFFLADYARTRGKRLEPFLLKEWGGWPTTIWLRHSDNHLPVDVKQRYLAFLGANVGSEAMPTPDEERADPRAADLRYDSAIMWLKEQCRGAKFPLVEKENATYGFRRNLLGLRPVGLAVAITTFLFPAISIILSKHLSPNEISSAVLNAYANASGSVQAATVFALFATTALVIVVDRKWVREAGDQYARALLSSCDVLRR